MRPRVFRDSRAFCFARSNQRPAFSVFFLFGGPRPSCLQWRRAGKHGDSALALGCLAEPGIRVACESKVQYPALVSAPASR